MSSCRMTPSKRKATFAQESWKKKKVTKPPGLKKEDNIATFDRCWEDDNLTEIIFSFCDIKSLNQIAQVRKSFADSSIIRHKHVVRAAMFDTGAANKKLNAVLPLVIKRKIWAPSPLRLLRVVNGKWCELCVEKKAKVESGLPAFGVFCCASCRLTYTCSIWPKKWLRYRFNPRVASQYMSSVSGRLLVWRHPYQESLSFEGSQGCGPLLTIEELAEDRKYYKLLGQFLKSYDVMNERRYDLFLKAYEECKEEAQVYQAETRLAKQHAQEAADDALKVKLHAFADKLSHEVGEHPWRQAALAYDISSGPKPVVLVFRAKVTEDIVKETVRSRSRVSALSIKNAATKLRSFLDALQRSRLLDFEFLSDDNRFQNALKTCYLEHYPDGKMIYALSKKDVELVAATKIGCIDPLLTVLNNCQKIHVIIRPQIIALSGRTIPDGMASTAQGLVVKLIRLDMSSLRLRTGSLEIWMKIIVKRFDALFAFLSLSFLSDEDLLQRHIKAGLRTRWFNHIWWQWGNRGSSYGILKASGGGQRRLLSKFIDRITKAKACQDTLLAELELRCGFRKILVPLIVATSPAFVPPELDQIAKLVAGRLFQLATGGPSKSVVASKPLQHRFDDCVQKFSSIFQFATLSFVSSDERVPSRIDYTYIVQFVKSFSTATVGGVMEANGCPQKLWALFEEFCPPTAMLAPVIVLTSKTTTPEEPEANSVKLAKIYFDGIVSNKRGTCTEAKAGIRPGFEIAVEGFPTLYKNAVDFLQWKRALGWKLAGASNGELWMNRFWTARAVELLLERDFREIRRHVESNTICCFRCNE